MSLKSINPATLEVIAEFKEFDDKLIKQKIDKAQNCYELWKNTTFSDRSELMHKAANYLRDNSAKFALTISQEVGKTLAAAEAEVIKSALVCDYYADNSETILKAEVVKSDASESYVEFDPIGIVLAVMPWNFPFWQVFRFAAPALMAGNVGMLKHASNVQKSAVAIESVFSTAGFPVGAFTNLVIGSSKVEEVINDDRIKAVTLTGSEKAGSIVASQAGREIKKTVLELGGSDPFIVLEDADINAACKSAVSARMQNNAGQSCIAAKRFIVHKSIADKFTQGITIELSKLTIGNPLDSSTNVGPLATEQMLIDIDSQVIESVNMGAKVLSGGKKPNLAGYYYEPTILSNVTKGMPAYDQELFGPVMPIIIVDNENDAVSVANDSIYGLGATIFSKDITKAKQIATKIESGCVFINNQVTSDPRLPFGGIKKSGYGRELSSYGIKEFVNIKTVWIK